MSGGPATYVEIVEYLKTVPAASQAWAQGLYSAGLSMTAVAEFIATMSRDAGSPLREAEEGVLSKEILKLNQVMGSVDAAGVANGKIAVKVTGVLSPGEQARVVRAVSGFCQPRFVPSKKFGHNGHAVMNAVRRAQANYLMSRIPAGASVVEVGPDVVNWIFSDDLGHDSFVKKGAYVGARPVLGPRDVVRVKWQRIVELVLRNREKFFSASVVARAEMLKDSYAKIFPEKKIQDIKALGEYIVSFDSNYDIKFSDMPVAMGSCGARAWYGCLVRAKGLTRTTRKPKGALDLLGVNYRVDWEAGRIDFRHPECQAFGYSHDVWEYMKYEEYNGFVWTTDTCHYVYSKGAETTSELLFFNVVRVPKVHRMYEPRFVENPYAGFLELTSIWATGEEVSGVPTRFSTVVFYVDQLNFSKVLEKRRALDWKGDLSVTLALVRSTNVRMWLHGTPVGVNKRIESKLAEATAVVVETLAAENRLSTNLAFGRAMEQYDMNLSKSGWLQNFLEHIIDLRAASGAVVGPLVRMWADVRSTLIDRALSSISEVRVGVRVVPAHLPLDVGSQEQVDGEHEAVFRSECRCAEIAEVRAAMAMAGEKERRMLDVYYGDKLFAGRCPVCIVDPEIFAGTEDQGKEDAKDDSSVSDSGIDDCSTAEGSVEADVVMGSWRDECSADRIEARAMKEFVDLEQYLAKSQLVECRIDATRIFDRGPVSDTLLAEFSTSRTRHVVLEFLSGRCVRTYGPPVGPLGAVYDVRRDAIIPTRLEGEVMYAPVANGFYYSCNRLRVWNGLDISAAVDYALDYGRVANSRKFYSVVLGVPGAGKTYGMMKRLAGMKGLERKNFLVLAVTKASVAAAQKYGREFGIPERLLDSRVMTLDRYLMHKKFSADLVCVDEFPMVHIGKVDAAVSISGAVEVRLYGDARQIPYDPFCAEFFMEYFTLGKSVTEDRVEFLPESHRLSLDACAMWLDQYPSIYPCSCCRVGEKERSTVRVERVQSMEAYRWEHDVRYHTFKQDERDELRTVLKMTGTAEDLRHRETGGLATVHEDQGSTHRRVMTVRLSTDYDKNASPRNPSLYNRERYVLTDTTRHTAEYVYVTMCAEIDLVCKRVALAGDAYRQSLVREKKGLGLVSKVDML